MRIQDLDQITNETIDLSQHLAIDDPSQTFKMTLLQLRDFFAGQLYPVGSTMFRLDARTPNECGFPGTWSKVAQDVSIHTAKSDGSDLGTTTGSNLQTVVLPQHTHTASSQSAGDHAHTASSQSAGDHTHTADSQSSGSHNHTASSQSAGDHTHPFGVTMAFDGSGGTFRIGWGQDPSRGKFSGTNSDIEDGGIGNAGAHSHVVTVDSGGAHTHGVTVDSGGAHTHGVTVNSAGSHSHGVTVNNAGTASATMDTRGSRILGHLWHRTA